MTQKKETFLLLISFLISALLISGVFWFLTKWTKVSEQPDKRTEPSNTKNQDLSSRLSLGEEILVTADTNPDKEAGVKAYAAGDFTTAINKFQSSLRNYRNDPETLIYLNNAKIGKSEALRVVVSVPIGGSLDQAKEILRGVAQAQDEVNRSGGINRVPLQIEIANDEGDSAIAKQLALEFIKDDRILAVLGHHSSEISVAAAPIYNHGSLVMITATSSSMLLSKVGKYVFRTVPTNPAYANTLSHYIIQNARLKKIAVCADSTTSIEQGFVQDYTQSIRQAGGKISRAVCDLSAPDFNPDVILSRAISDGADSLLLIPKIGRLSPAFEIARANKGRLALFGYSGMYAIQTLQLGQPDVRGMVLPVSWHPASVPDDRFPDNAAKLWGGQVSWRTATSYDALQTIVAGLKQANTRDELQKALSAPNFSVSGATGTIQFLPFGDRKSTPFLVKIEPGKISGTGYDFVLVR